MSADSIAACPACYVKEHPDKTLIDVTVGELNEFDRELREYFEFYIHRGHVVADYSATCRDCGYHVAFKSEYPLPEPNTHA